MSSSSISPVSFSSPNDDDNEPKRPRSALRALFAHLLGHRFAGRTVALLALVVAATSITIGFTADDYGFRTALETGLRPSFDLFRFASGGVSENLHLIAAGTFPWWMSPDFKLHFIRPLTSLLFTLDFAVFGDHPLGYHLTSIALYVALLFATLRIFRHVLPRATATLALLVFALRGAHVLPYAWICAQHMLVGVVPAMFGLLAYVRAEKDGWKPGRILAPALFVVGLAGSETALAITPLWVAFAFAQAHASGDWRRGIRACVPPGVIVAAYLVVYRVVGGGTHSAVGYLDPMTDPLGFVRAASTRVPTLLGDALLAFPAQARTLPLIHVCAGIAGLLLCATLLFSNRTIAAQERAALAWLVPGALLAVCLGGASGSARLLLVPDLGFSALIAVLLRHGFAHRNVARVTGTAGLVVAHLFVAPLVSIVQIRGLARVARTDESIAATAELGATPEQRVLVMASADPEVFFYPKEILADKASGLVSCWSVLSAASAPHRITRTGERSFAIEELAPPDGDGYDDQYFASRRFAVGDQVRQCGASIRVDAVEEGKPSRLSVELDEPLESGDLTFLAWDGERLRHLIPPGVGQTANLPWSPDLGVGHVARIVRGVRRLAHRLFGA